ncbi:MAG: NAD(P)-dependent oxidoreductase [Nitrospirae bacterium]|nr:NAD(P)-dependent oxidoreductase [Nitrospirota bacterium]
MRGVIALTGATGFIGSVIARKLVQEGWCVRALIRPPSSSARLAGTTVQWVQGTFEDLDSLERLVGDADVVVHCAGAVRGITEADFFQANVEAVARLAHLASSRNPAPRFLLISSLAAREPNLSPYAASKRMGEIALTKVGDRLTWTVLRPPAVYGPGDREMLPLLRLMLRGIAPVVGGSDARFSMLYVDDLADAVVKWLASDSRENRVFELDDGHPGGYSWCEIVETVERLRGKGVVRVRVPGPVLNLAARLNTLAASIIGYRPMLTLGKVRELRHPDWVCDNSIYYRVANWAPTVRLEEGLRYTLGLSASPAIGTRA